MMDTVLYINNKTKQNIFTLNNNTQQKQVTSL